jgi:bifunctional DNA-binding transcriptional regulator/antitoxin component of YhaV-PrlF toxin-antitoxin module
LLIVEAAMEIEVRKCGDNFVITFPSELAAQLTWGAGDILAAEVVDQGLQIKRTMTVHDHALQIARECMDKYRETFEALAKS